MFRVVDWILRLPEVEEDVFEAELDRMEEELKMPYITSVERRAEKRGRDTGLREGLERGLDLGRQEGLDFMREAILATLEGRFQRVDPDTRETLGRVADPETLKSLARTAVGVASEEEFLSRLPQA